MRFADFASMLDHVRARGNRRTRCSSFSRTDVEIKRGFLGRSCSAFSEDAADRWAAKRRKNSGRNVPCVAPIGARRAGRRIGRPNVFFAPLCGYRTLSRSASTGSSPHAGKLPAERRCYFLFSVPAEASARLVPDGCAAVFVAVACGAAFGSTTTRTALPTWSSSEQKAIGSPFLVTSGR